VNLHASPSEVNDVNQPESKTRLAELTLGRPNLADIAREAGCSRSFVSAVAAGRKKPSARLKIAAARVLALPVEAIFPEEVTEE
jgi:DNA-binding XRE family transcriptional regulator